MAEKKYLSKIIKGSQTIHIKDTEAREAIEQINITTRGFTFAYNPADKSLDLTPLGNTEAVYDPADKSLNLIF